MHKTKTDGRIDAALIESSYNALAPQIDAIVADFYQELFTRYPAVKPLFKSADHAGQRKKLAGALALVVANLRRPAELGAALRGLGARHAGYGAAPEHYDAVAETLLGVLRRYAGSLWSAELEQAWTDALVHIKSVMLQGAGVPAAAGSGAADAAGLELVKMRAAVDATTTAIMMIDRDFVITYANRATVDLLTRIEPVLRQVYPRFRADQLIGTCIDVFHASPEHQRRLLGNPANLPYAADIKVGPLTLRINVTAQTDAAGNYIGNTLEWYDVTEQRQKEAEIARLQSAVAGAQTALMLCDENLVISYVNPAVVALLKAREPQLRAVFSGFEAERLVGKSIDIFHKNPGHQRRLLTNPANLPAKAEIRVADLEFEVNATAILDGNGKYMGNMVEWRDITETRNGERRLQELIEAASNGKLDDRIDPRVYSGFMQRLANGINALLDAMVTPMKATMHAIGALADGKLTTTIDGSYAGDFAELSAAVNGCIGNLRNIVQQITESAGSIGTSAREIAQGNTDLSQRTEEQASSLEETAASMEQLTGTVKQNADNAKLANQLAASARDQAEKGGKVVRDAIAAMGEINGSSKKIADIISVIDEIAFQTNLLALNAAVEAARAGEQGRGFAVVATEVRNLAQRSAAAAKEIKALINDSVGKVEEGSRLVNGSGAMLEEIMTAVKKVSDIIAEIAAASEEQSAGIEQVNKAVMQMDETTQQNAALVEQAAAASESMEEQSMAMVELMRQFDTGDGVPAAVQQDRPAAAGKSGPKAAPGRGASTPRRASRGTPQAAPARRKAAAAATVDAGGDEDWAEF